jgi:hypothetical protein
MLHCPFIPPVIAIGLKLGFVLRDEALPSNRHHFVAQEQSFARALRRSEYFLTSFETTAPRTAPLSLQIGTQPRLANIQVVVVNTRPGCSIAHGIAQH